MSDIPSNWTSNISDNIWGTGVEKKVVKLGIYFITL